MPGTNISRYELMTVYITSDCNEIQAHPRNLIVSADRSWCIVSKVYKVKLSVNTITYKKNLPIYMHTNCDHNKECTYKDNLMIQAGPLKPDEPLSESPLQVMQPIQTR